MTKTNQLPNTNRRKLGGGAYSLQELRAYLTFSGKPKDGDHASYWLKATLNPVAHKSKRADYNFDDLVSLFVVRELRKRGVRPRAIKEAEEWLRDRLGIERPFVVEDIKTDGVDVFYRDEAIRGQIEAASRKGQQAIRAAVSEKLTSVRYTDGTASSWEPVQGIILDPEIQFGEPVIAGSRLTTELVAGVADSLGIDRAAERFCIDAASVRSAMAFQSTLAASSN